MKWLIGLSLDDLCSGEHHPAAIIVPPMDEAPDGFVPATVVRVSAEHRRGWAPWITPKTTVPATITVRVESGAEIEIPFFTGQTEASFPRSVTGEHLVVGARRWQAAQGQWWPNDVADLVKAGRANEVPLSAGPQALASTAVQQLRTETGRTWAEAFPRTTDPRMVDEANATRRSITGAARRSGLFGSQEARASMEDSFAFLRPGGTRRP